MVKQIRIAIAALALGLAAGCEDATRSAQRAEVKLSDPRAVVAATCAKEASPMCACIVDETVRTLQAGPREVLAVFEAPETVWSDVLKTLDPKTRDKTMNARIAAETSCKNRVKAINVRDMSIRRMGNRLEPPKRSKLSIHSSCATEGNSGVVCDCYEETLKVALSKEEYNELRNDAVFPPPLEAIPKKQRRTTLATIASARSVCGLKTLKP